MSTITRTTPTVAPGQPVNERDLLGWAFAVFSTLRITAYVPTLAAIHASGQSDQHSLWSWLVFLGSNATMALWLHRGNGRRVNAPVLVNAGNAAMCAAICTLIVWTRLDATWWSRWLS